MKLTEDRRKKLRRVNLIAKGLVLKAKCTEDLEDKVQALHQALFEYGCWCLEGYEAGER